MMAEIPQAREDRAPHAPRGQKKFSETVYLDSYDDLFSDFDYGPYEARRVSDDFLRELETRFKYVRQGKVDLLLVVPDGERDREVEVRARKRLKQVFAAKANAADAHLHQFRRSGIFYAAVGSGVLVLSWALASIFAGPQAPLFSLASVVITPAGWFWGVKGLERLFDIPAEFSRKRSLYALFSDATISFDEASNIPSPIRELCDTKAVAQAPPEAGKERERVPPDVQQEQQPSLPS
ncbi:MAG: hypothetical protein PHF51_02685 [Candidatus ainarchaeum sp.]|nr:hypothetical protein [Candidatus ainarchaeum sp.]